MRWVAPPEKHTDRRQPAAGTNPVQTYIDLVRSGGRGEEAAEAILATARACVVGRRALTSCSGLRRD